MFSRENRWAWELVVAFVLLASVAGIVLCSWQSRWSGKHKLRVYVQVVDADLRKPLAKVPVTVFSGPWDLSDAPLSEVDLHPHTGDSGTECFVTDDEGVVSFIRRFPAGGSDRPLVQRGTVTLRGSWLQVAPPGYGTVLLPIDGQSAPPRDINDERAVVITLALTKPASKTP